MNAGTTGYPTDGAAALIPRKEGKNDRRENGTGGAWQAEGARCSGAASDLGAEGSPFRTKGDWPDVQAPSNYPLCAICTSLMESPAIVSRELTKIQSLNERTGKEIL
jgi:hypothetical protein